MIDLKIDLNWEYFWEKLMGTPLKYMLKFLSILINYIKRKVLIHISKQVEIERARDDVEIGVNEVYPGIYFQIKLRNKTPTDIYVKHITARVCFNGIPLQKLHWFREDGVDKKNGKRNTLVVNECTEPDSVKDLPAKKIARLICTFFHLNGYIIYQLGSGS